MANRVYAYTSNEIPKKGSNLKRMKSLYENKFEPGLAGLLMCGHNYIKQAPSPIWEKSTCSVSKFDLEFINSYLDLILKTVKSDNRAAIYRLRDLSEVTERDINRAKDIVRKNKGRFIVMDFSEVSSMSEETLEKIVKLNADYAKASIKAVINFKKYMKGGIFSKDPVVNFIKFIHSIDGVYASESGVFGFHSVLYYS